MKPPLPPLAAVRVFEAAARLGSFTRAADELGMTQSAISYQIKVLEDRIGSALFRRQRRGVELTPVGKRFASGVGEGLDLLREAYRQAVDRGEDALAISVAPTFAVSFLASRLGHFHLANPSLSVKVEVSQQLVDFEAEGVDLAIRSGAGGWPGLSCHLLLRSDPTPMLSPELADSVGGIRAPEDLLKLPIIEAGDPWWRNWFAASGVPTPDLPAPSAPSLGAQVLEANAVLAGKGVGKLTPALHADALMQGRLIRPFERTQDDGQSFWLVCPRNRLRSSAAQRFRNWLMAEVREAESSIPSR